MALLVILLEWGKPYEKVGRKVFDDNLMGICHKCVYKEFFYMYFILISDSHQNILLVNTILSGPRMVNSK